VEDGQKVLEDGKVAEDEAPENGVICNVDENGNGVDGGFLGPCDKPMVKRCRGLGISLALTCSGARCGKDAPVERRLQAVCQPSAAVGGHLEYRSLSYKYEKKFISPHLPHTDKKSGVWWRWW
jgi:hypothetical protein